LAPTFSSTGSFTTGIYPNLFWKAREIFLEVVFKDLADWGLSQMFLVHTHYIIGLTRSVTYTKLIQLTTRLPTLFFSLKCPRYMDANAI